MLKNLSKPLQYALIAVLAVAAWMIISPMIFPETATHTVAKPKPKSVKAGEVAYLDEDFKTHFKPASLAVKNTFKPIIAKLPSARGGPGGGPQVNLLPPEYAGGEQNWMYTGSAEIDGVLEALLENRTTGDSIFLKVGDTWKGISVEEITDDSLVLSSPDTGLEKTLKLPAEDAPVPSAGPGGFAPAQVNQPLSGNIGPMTVQPDGSGMMNGAATGGFTGGGNGFGNGGNGFGNGRRRGRRGGGGGGFGG